MSRHLSLLMFSALLLSACGKSNFTSDRSFPSPPGNRPGWTADLIKSSFNCAGYVWCDCYVKSITASYTPAEAAQEKADETAQTKSSLVQDFKFVADSCEQLTKAPSP